MSETGRLQNCLVSAYIGGLLTRNQISLREYRVEAVQLYMLLTATRPLLVHNDRFSRILSAQQYHRDDLYFVRHA